MIYERHQSKPSNSYIPCDIADKFWNDMCRKGPEQLCFLKLPSITNPYALIIIVARAGSSNMGDLIQVTTFPTIRMSVKYYSVSRARYLVIRKFIFDNLEYISCFHRSGEVCQ